MSAADDAYKAAEAEIEKARAEGATRLDLAYERFAALTRLPDSLGDLTAVETLVLGDSAAHVAISDLSAIRFPPNLKTLRFTRCPATDLQPLAALTGLQRLDLDNSPATDLQPLAALTGLQSLFLRNSQATDLQPLGALTGLQELYLNDSQATDLQPLAALTGLQGLDLDNSPAADLQPLAALTGLQRLSLNNARAVDLRPLRSLRKLAENPGILGLNFRNSGAVRADPKIAEIAEIENKKTRAARLFDYLEDWVPPGGDVQEDADREGAGASLSVTALIEAQDLAGWRFSPEFGALELYVSTDSPTARQTRLADMAAQRLADLRDKLNRSSNSYGLRQDVLTEADRFAHILDDRDTPLTERSLELWGSAVALGGLLDANDSAVAQGRDALDCLTAESRAALQTFLAIAAGLIRAFPETQDLDDSFAGFNRTALPPEFLTGLVERAVAQALVSAESAALIARVAQVGEGTGRQADKAYSVTAKGSKNLALTAALLGGLGGVAAGMTSDIGTDISNHYELSEKALRFLDSSAEELHRLIEGLSPDERANLRSVLKDLETKRAKAASRGGRP